jgi:ribosomal protein S18 acetylase RimI-like enzyme
MNTESILIRKFEPRDYDKIIGLWDRADLPVRALGRDSYANICRQVTQTNVILLVAEIEGRLIGTVLGTHDSRKGWVNRLAIDTGFRRKNLATRLIAEVEKWFQSNGLDVFACVIESDNDASMELFSKLGYTEWDVRYFSKRKSDGS